LRYILNSGLDDFQKGFIDSTAVKLIFDSLKN